MGKKQRKNQPWEKYSVLNLIFNIQNKRWSQQTSWLSIVHTIGRKRDYERQGPGNKKGRLERNDNRKPYNMAMLKCRGGSFDFGSIEEYTRLAEVKQHLKLVKRRAAVPSSLHAANGSTCWQSGGVGQDTDGWPGTSWCLIGVRASTPCWNVRSNKKTIFSIDIEEYFFV